MLHASAGRLEKRRPGSAQDDPRWHNADSDRYESEGEGERYEFGQECLDRMALALGGATVVPLASRYLPALLADRDWRQRHAALICLAQIAEGCVKIMHNNHSGLVDMCLQVRGFADFHAALHEKVCHVSVAVRHGKRAMSAKAGCVMCAAFSRMPWSLI